MKTKNRLLLLTIVLIAVVILATLVVVVYLPHDSSLRFNPVAGSYLQYERGNETQILLLNASSKYGTYNESFGDINKGDPCLIVNITVRSDYPTYIPNAVARVISFSANLYNKEGKIVGSIITPPSTGTSFADFGQVFLESGQKGSINIFLAYNKTIDTKDLDHYDLYVSNITGVPQP